MTKRELIDTLKRRGVNGMLAAKRIKHSIEMDDLADGDQITMELFEKWIDVDGPERLRRERNLSDSDLALIGRIAFPKKPKERKQ